jgi:hypothetical protein
MQLQMQTPTQGPAMDIPPHAVLCALIRSANPVLEAGRCGLVGCCSHAVWEIEIGARGAYLNFFARQLRGMITRTRLVPNATYHIVEVEQGQGKHITGMVGVACF